MNQDKLKNEIKKFLISLEFTEEQAEDISNKCLVYSLVALYAEFFSIPELKKIEQFILKKNFIALNKIKIDITNKQIGLFLYNQIVKNLSNLIKILLEESNQQEKEKIYKTLQAINNKSILDKTLKYDSEEFLKNIIK